jgi:hypothetical protein
MVDRLPGTGSSYAIVVFATAPLLAETTGALAARQAPAVCSRRYLWQRRWLSFRTRVRATFKARFSRISCQEEKRGIAAGCRKERDSPRTWLRPCHPPRQSHRVGGHPSVSPAGPIGEPVRYGKSTDPCGRLPCSAARSRNEARRHPPGDPGHPIADAADPMPWVRRSFRMAKNALY